MTSPDARVDPTPDPPLGWCGSDMHARRGKQRVPATHVGTFDCSALNGRAPEPRRAHCLTCTALLVDVGCFTPDPGQSPTPNPRDLVSGA
ncbi:hypothetical protein GCM10027270_13700 [Nocardioides ginkgobilobae]